MQVGLAVETLATIPTAIWGDELCLKGHYAADHNAQCLFYRGPSPMYYGATTTVYATRITPVHKFLHTHNCYTPVGRFIKYIRHT